MVSRCPESTYISPGKLLNYSWFIYSRGYANIKPSEGDYVLGEIFSLSKKDELNLDHHENVHNGFYHKEKLKIQTLDGYCLCLVYIDSIQNIGEPKHEYIERINNGLVSSNLPIEYVNKYIRPYVPASPLVD